MKKIEFEEGSGNVFKDLDFPNADTHLLKSDIVTRIEIILRRRRWTKKKTAKALGISQTKLSRILQGNFRDYSVEYLSRLLAILEGGVKSVIYAPESQPPAKIWEINEKESKRLIEKLQNLLKAWTEESSKKYKRDFYSNYLHQNNQGKNVKMGRVIISCKIPVASRDSNSIRNLNFLRELPTPINKPSASVSFTSLYFVAPSIHPLHIQTYSDDEQFLAIDSDYQKSFKSLEWLATFRNDDDPPKAPRWQPFQTV